MAKLITELLKLLIEVVAIGIMMWIPIILLISSDKHTNRRKKERNEE